MKAKMGVLVVCTMLALAAWLQMDRQPRGQEKNAADHKQAEEPAQALEKAAAEAGEAYKQSHEEAERTWKIAKQIRERDGIIDPAPHRDSVPTARSGNPDDAQAYRVAKEIYLKANAEAGRKLDQAWELRRKPLEEAREKLEEAQEKVRISYKAAAAIRQKFDIIDQDPESDDPRLSIFMSPDVSHPPGVLETYRAAKREYLKARAERDKLEVRAFPSEHASGSTVHARMR